MKAFGVVVMMLIFVSNVFQSDKKESSQSIDTIGELYSMTDSLQDLFEERAQEAISLIIDRVTDSVVRENARYLAEFSKTRRSQKLSKESDATKEPIYQNVKSNFGYFQYKEINPIDYIDLKLTDAAGCVRLKALVNQ